MEAKQLITKILNSSYCGDLFERNADEIKSTYKQYAKIIHPDICDEQNANDAFQRLCKFYDDAIKRINNGSWKKSNELFLTNRKDSIQYICKTEFEIGSRYISDNNIIYVIDKEKRNYLDQYIKKVKALKYADSKMKDLYSSRMPRIEEAKDNCLIIKKEPWEFPMDLFISAYKDKLDMKDIAWMISRLCDLQCFMRYQGTVLNGFKQENLFINPNTHSIHIYGGWWYAVNEGNKMTGVSKDIYSIMPLDAKNSKLASRTTDIESMRVMFQNICKDKDIPKSIRNWLNAGSSDDPIHEYNRWNKALDDAYGKRHFKVFVADPTEIYKMKGDN